MTKKQLEQQRKEFDEFVANVEKMGGRFLTEDELRLKINGGGDAGGDGDDDESQEENESTPIEAGGTDDFAGDPTVESTGSGENALVTEPEENKEDDDKSFWDSVCEAVGGVVDTVAGAVSGAAHAVGEFIEDIIDFFTGGSKDDEKTVEEEDSGNGTGTGAANSTDGGTETENSKSSDTAQNKPTSEGEKTNTNGDLTIETKNLSYDSATDTFSSKPSLSDVNLFPARPDINLAAAMEAANSKSKDYYDYDVNASLSRSIEKNWIQDIADNILASNGIKGSGITFLPGDGTKSGVKDVGLYNMGAAEYSSDFPSRVMTDNLGDSGFVFSLSYKHEF